MAPPTLTLTSTCPGRAIRTPDERRRFLPLLRALARIQRANPGMFNHAGTGIAYWLMATDRSPEAWWLAERILAEYPPPAPDELRFGRREP
jgi:hypothetical protein